MLLIDMSTRGVLIGGVLGRSCIQVQRLQSDFKRNRIGKFTSNRQNACKLHEESAVAPHLDVTSIKHCALFCSSSSSYSSSSSTSPPAAILSSSICSASSSMCSSGRLLWLEPELRMEADGDTASLAYLSPHDASISELIKLSSAWIWCALSKCDFKKDAGERRRSLGRLRTIHSIGSDIGLVGSGRASQSVFVQMRIVHKTIGLLVALTFAHLSHFLVAVGGARTATLGYAVHLELVGLQKVLVAHLFITDVTGDPVGHLGRKIRVHDSENGRRGNTGGSCGRSSSSSGGGRVPAEHVELRRELMLLLLGF
ncbi:hypothetical protein BpHYR1_047776 [Brachionus plicatilis]|uniref:Uncharacterized protein n=1 Tax=Brachionus plicatilis TaxID=10195 RepID=A0A3M7T8G2_BRAPC|nr:hypothetical protein BpHYR1_047776 [Brachionus plicatilis]